MTNANDVRRYTQETPLLDYGSETIQSLVSKRKWRELSTKERITEIYLYVRDEIMFGYNKRDEIPASHVIRDGMGQCNTKSTLLMALLRAVDIPCRFHGFTIDKALQRGAFTGIWYALLPQNVVHSWVEINYAERWYNLEGVILDLPYLKGLQERFSDCATNFCGYGVYTEDLMNPTIDWNECDTYIQELGINRDFGLFDSPDDFYRKHGQEVSFIKMFLFQKIIRGVNNRNVAEIRASQLKNGMTPYAQVGPAMDS
jgi:Transglutaminase-like superfamily